MGIRSYTDVNQNFSDSYIGVSNFLCLWGSARSRLARARRSSTMILDRIGRQEVLLPINHNYNKIGDILVFFVIKTQETATVVFASSESKPFKSAHSCMGASLLIPSLLVNCTLSSLAKSPNQCCELSLKSPKRSGY